MRIKLTLRSLNRMVRTAYKKRARKRKRRRRRISNKVATKIHG
jgi:hypothetical protein